MATNKLQLPVIGFPDGLNTEATVLNALPTELLEGSVNCELKINGDVKRRRGVDFIGVSTAGGYLQPLRSGADATETVHESPSSIFIRLTAPNGDIVSRVVTDLNGSFSVFEATNEGLANSDTPSQTISRGINSSDAQKGHTMSWATSGDRLYFAGRHCNPGYLKVDATNAALEVVFIDVMIRNPNQTEEGDVRKNALADGTTRWYECIEAHTSSPETEPGDGTGEPERFWTEKQGAIPTSVASWANATAYTTSIVKQYNKRTTATDTDLHPTTVEFFAGRIWLTGDPRNPNDLYFSQVKINDFDVEKFYQDADPFNADDSAVVADDGGVISLQGAGLAVSLKRLSTSLMIGTTTSIWQVNGADGIFKATSFSLQEVLFDGVDSVHSIVQIGKEQVIFGQSDIWRTKAEESVALSTTGAATFQSLSDHSLTTLYKSIPASDKARAVAVYSASDHRVYYFHNDSSTTFTSRYGANVQPGYFTKCLVLDTRFEDDVPDGTPIQAGTRRGSGGSWYPEWTFTDNGNDSSPYIAFPFSADDVELPDNTVTDNDGDTVISAGSDIVVANAGTTGNDVVLFNSMGLSSTGGITTVEHAFCRLIGSGTVDYSSDVANATATSAKIRAGIQTYNDILHNKAGVYITFVFKKTETGTVIDDVDTGAGGCFLRTAWEYATSSASNKFSAAKQVYVPHKFTGSVVAEATDGHDHIKYRHRVRGRGTALGIELTSDGDKDFHLIGLATQFHAKND